LQIVQNIETIKTV